MARNALVALGLLAAVTLAPAQIGQAGEEEGGAKADELAARLRKKIVDGIAGGRKPQVYLKLAGRPMRVKLLSADADGVTVSAMGSQVPLSWKKIPPARLGGMAMKFAEGGEDILLVARYYALNALRDETEKACQAAREADPKLEPAVREVLALLPRLELPKVVIPKSAGKPKAAPRGANHEGRMLPPMPEIKKPVMFNTPEADAIVSAMQIYPRNNPWNEDISKLPVHERSEALINNIGANGTLEFNWDMCYIIVPADQPRVDVKITSYPGESDKGPFPMPDNAPIEGWPVSGGELERLQRVGRGDRHVILVDPARMMLHEFFVGRKVGGKWQGACAATFNLRSNKTRPRGWTSSDAAGLPIFPAVVRYDEVERGMVEHCMRVTVRRTRREFIYPATHHAGRTADKNVVAMGERLRLKADFDVSRLPKHAKAVALGLKKYGMFVADNGGDWRISVAPDKRIQGMRSLRQIRGRDFEVVKTTGPNEGPRGPGGWGGGR